MKLKPVKGFDWYHGNGNCHSTFSADILRSYTINDFGFICCKDVQFYGTWYYVPRMTGMRDSSRGQKCQSIGPFWGNDSKGFPTFVMSYWYEKFQKSERFFAMKRVLSNGAVGGCSLQLLKDNVYRSIAYVYSQFAAKKYLL